MNKKKKDKVTPLVTFALFLVFTGALVYQTLPEKEPVILTSQKPLTESIETEWIPETQPEENNDVNEEMIENTKTLNEPIQTTFDEAFAVARSELGKGNTFIWNGNEYTTNLAEEVQSLQQDGDQLLADSTLNTDNDLSKLDLKKISTTSIGISKK